MWNIDYKIENEEVIAIITVDSGYVVDHGVTTNGEEMNYHIYTATRGTTPSLPILKTSPFSLDSNGKPLELQLIEGGVKKKVKKTQENVSNAKKK